LPEPLAVGPNLRADRDTRAYLAAYSDVAAADIDPLQHFLQFGIYEGRSSFGDGVFH
jgi:hypothetical protein